jgi:lipopolysaccharide export system protein LptA
MKLLSSIALVTSLISVSSSATEMEITAKTQSLSKDSKHQIYTGNVKIAFDGSKLRTTSTYAKFKNGESILEGNVEIMLDNAVARADKVTFTPSEHGVVARMDKVILTYH